MTDGTTWRRRPRDRIEAACAELGQPAVVQAYVDLLAGREVDAALLETLGGRYAGQALPDEHNHYWLRVWGARGLLWAWSDEATAALEAALADEHWRVREMAAKVVARHRIDDALPLVAALRDDPVPRVRAASARAVMRLTDAAG